MESIALGRNGLKEMLDEHFVPRRSSSKLDPSRIIYHHASGNLSSMHTSNFYPNWVPIQEMSDWFEHWATEGIKPFFTCEYGAPFMWDWAMFRGWYQGQRSFGSAVAPVGFLSGRMERPVSGRPGIRNQRAREG